MNIEESRPSNLHRDFEWLVNDIDEALRKFVSRTAAGLGLYEMIGYHLGFTAVPSGAGSPGRRGKRTRALLTHTIGSSLGSSPAVSRSTTIAAEMMHAASLVHDDIQDGDPVRWNRSTVWNLYGVPHAINVGDAMIALTYQSLADLAELGVPADRVLLAIQAFIQAHQQMTEGQYLDIALTGGHEVPVQQYFQIVTLKTAAAFSCVCRVPAIVSGASPAVVDAFAAFGNALGVLYQICDDLASIWASEAATGKRSLQDVIARKSSLPMILGAAVIGTPFRTLVGEVAPSDACERLEVLGGAIRRMLEAHDVYAMCASHADEQVDAAFRALKETGISGRAREVLVSIARTFRDMAQRPELPQIPERTNSASSG